jgi:hypothetical protein
MDKTTRAILHTIEGLGFKVVVRKRGDGYSMTATPLEDGEPVRVTADELFVGACLLAEATAEDLDEDGGAR